MTTARRAGILCVCLVAPGCGRDVPSTAPPIEPPEIQKVAEKPRPKPVFVDIAESAGLTTPHREPADGRFRLVETMGSGLGLIDFDGDGDLDLFVGQGGAIPPALGDPQWSSKLYRNDGLGKFVDVTEKAGVTFGRYVQGVAVGDYDGDGRDDLYVAGFGRSALYRNVDGSRFVDVAEKAGVAGSGWPTSCAFADLDGDGDLDLFVVHYLANTVDANGEPTVRCNASPGKLGYCPPNAFEPEPDVLYRNNGDGTFTDVSIASGIAKVAGNGLGLAIADFDDDGKLDVFVANDQSPNLMWRNLGNLRFEEVGLSWGVALSETGQTRAGMGVAAGDFDGDGRIDLCVTNFYEEGVTLYRNLGQARFQVATSTSRLLVPTRSKLGFGAVFLDYDNDGRLDLFLANGHINDVTSVGMPYRMEAQLFHNESRGRFADVSSEAGDYFRQPRLGRATAVGDLDNDGDPDLVVSHLGTPPALLRNESTGGNSLRLTLLGAGRSRSAIGAKVSVEIDKQTLTRWVVGGSSYLAASDPRILIGLGKSSQIDLIEIKWPSGKVQLVGKPPAVRALTIVEGESPKETRLPR